MLIKHGPQPRTFRSLARGIPGRSNTQTRLTRERPEKQYLSWGKGRLQNQWGQRLCRRP